jgi:hypothetical protein
MAMVWTSFKEHYYKPNGIAWLDFEMRPRDRENAKKREVITVAEAAQKFYAPENIQAKLNNRITNEVYKNLIGKELDLGSLQERGFRVIKNDETRIVFHNDCADLLIKVCPSEVPLESSSSQGIKEEKESVFNINLMRAARRHFFWTQLNDPNDSEACDFRQHFKIPIEYIYSSPHAESEASDHQKCFFISENQGNIYSPEESLVKIKAFTPRVRREIAQATSAFIKKTGMHILRQNYVLSRDAEFQDSKHWRFEIIDSDSQDEGAQSFDPVAQVLSSLLSFRDHYCRKQGMLTMAKGVDKAIVDYLCENDAGLNSCIHEFKTSITPLPVTQCQKRETGALICISILLPVIPIVFLIESSLASCYVFRDPRDQFDVVYDTPCVAAFNKRSIASFSRQSSTDFLIADGVV